MNLSSKFWKFSKIKYGYFQHVELDVTHYYDFSGYSQQSFSLSVYMYVKIPYFDLFNDVNSSADWILWLKYFGSFYPIRWTNKTDYCFYNTHLILQFFSTLFFFSSNLVVFLILVFKRKVNCLCRLFFKEYLYVI